MMWAMLAIGIVLGLGVGAVAGWILCSCITVGHNAEQRMLIYRLRSAVQVLLLAGGKYVDDPHLSQACAFAQMVIEED